MSHAKPIAYHKPTKWEWEQIVRLWDQTPRTVSLRQLERMFKCSRSALHRGLQARGVDTQRQPQSTLLVPCHVCGKPVYRTRGRRRTHGKTFCCDSEYRTWLRSPDAQAQRMQARDDRRLVWQTVPRATMRRWPKEWAPLHRKGRIEVYRDPGERRRAEDGQAIVPLIVVHIDEEVRNYGNAHKHRVADPEVQPGTAASPEDPGDAAGGPASDCGA